MLMNCSDFSVVFEIPLAYIQVEILVPLNHTCTLSFFHHSIETVQKAVLKMLGGV